MLFGPQMETSIRTHRPSTLRHSVVLIICLFMLIGCNAEDKKKVDSEKPEKDIPDPLSGEGKSSQPPSDRPAEKKEDEKMEYEARELLKDFGPPPVNQKLPRLTIFRTQAAWEKYKKAHEKENENLADVVDTKKIKVTY